MVKKRFIAGATCPSCHCQDRLRWRQKHDVEQVECVECGYRDVRVPQSVEQSQQLSLQTKQHVIGIFKPDDKG
ncbi:YheV family putative zinc ribbon protein [Photobacterium nomapromontoriensis]|uniref:YheV family putative zinc ribbon protein n=1 Tax=Photobacterium nomapromontoriensis TaxID=2910237 RepID=UPI003D0BE37A